MRTTGLGRAILTLALAVVVAAAAVVAGELAGRVRQARATHVFSVSREPAFTDTSIYSTNLSAPEPFSQSGQSSAQEKEPPDPSRDAGAAVASMVFAGDSVTLGWYTYGLLPRHQVWAAGSLDTRSLCTEAFIYDAQGLRQSLCDTLARNAPQTLALCVGLNGVSWMQPDYFTDTYRASLRQIRAAAPDTYILLLAVPPITAEREARGLFASNEQIARCNQSIAQLAAEEGCGYFDPSDCLRDEDGALRPDFSSGDGIHWNAHAYRAAMAALKEAIAGQGLLCGATDG